MDESDIPRNAAGIQEQLDYTQKRTAGASVFLGSPEWSEIIRAIERKMVSDGVPPVASGSLVAEFDRYRTRASEAIQTAGAAVAAMTQQFEVIRDKARRARESSSSAEFDL